LLIALVIGALLWPLITTAETTSTIATVVFEGSTTQDEFLVASSIPATPTPQELVQGTFYDAPVMVRIAKAESSFIPTAKNPNSTATGLFQILKGTYIAYDCSGVATNPIDNINCARKIYNAEGTTPWNSSRSVWGQ
jgi:hypothetical protein